ncbi:ulp1 protease family, C-terminal catalytic domain-containing protein [Tanacetum coccineum]
MMMRKRIKMETSQRCLGSLEHYGEFNPEEEQNGIDLFKGLDVYIEPLSDRIPVAKEEYYAKIIQQFEKILEERNELIHTLTDGVTKSSKDEDSDNDSDQDNDNNKDDEEEPMTDGKNQNENERQSGIQKEKENIEDMGKRTKEGGSEANDNGKKDEYDVNIENEFEKVNEKDDEEYYVKIIQQFEKILEERNELIHTLTDGVTKFEDDQMMFDFCKQYKEMFNDAEFNLYESSKDEDSDNDSDPDNDNNKDDEEEPMADGKNQNENERQSGIQKEKENIEDMDKGTEEGGGKANDNGEKDEDDLNIENEFEKVNEKDDEEAVSMDVDDPNEKMKEKEIDKEKLSDSIEKEQQVESEKEKQYEADKVEKVQEIQDEHNRLTQDQFWDKEYHLTDSQYEEDFVFETKDGAATIRDYMQTLAPQLKVESNVIDTFSIVFFSIIDHEHYYLVVFNFLKGNTVIIDNSKTQMTYDAKYKTVCELLKKLFSMHLEKVEHPRAKDVLNKKPTILRPRWGTKENDTNCGIFLMMHMEHYNEETAKNWNLEFLKEKEGNTFDIINMRVRLETKILSHEINIHREKISTEAQEFARRNTDKNLRKQMIKEAIKTKKEKQESERVQSAI